MLQAPTIIEDTSEEVQLGDSGADGSASAADSPLTLTAHETLEAGTELTGDLPDIEVCLALHLCLFVHFE